MTYDYHLLFLYFADKYDLDVSDERDWPKIYKLIESYLKCEGGI